jgi:hypothetical protein
MIFRVRVMSRASVVVVVMGVPHVLYRMPAVVQVVLVVLMSELVEVLPGTVGVVLDHGFSFRYDESPT